MEEKERGINGEEATEAEDIREKGNGEEMVGRKNGENGKEDKGKAEEDYMGLKNKELEHGWTEAAAKVGDMTAVVTTMDGRDIRTGQVDGQVAAEMH